MKGITVAVLFALSTAEVPAFAASLSCMSGNDLPIYGLFAETNCKDCVADGPSSFFAQALSYFEGDLDYQRIHSFGMTEWNSLDNPEPQGRAYGIFDFFSPATEADRAYFCRWVERHPNFVDQGIELRLRRITGFMVPFESVEYTSDNNSRPLIYTARFTSFDALVAANKRLGAIAAKNQAGIPELQDFVQGINGAGLASADGFRINTMENLDDKIFLDFGFMSLMFADGQIGETFCRLIGWYWMYPKQAPKTQLSQEPNAGIDGPKLGPNFQTFHHHGTK